MSSSLVRAALRTALADRAPHVAIRDVENLAVEPVIDDQGRPATFLGVLYFATEQIVGVGAPDAQTWRESGTIQILIFYPAGRGIDGAAELADSLRHTLGGKDLPVSAPGQRLTIVTADPLSQYAARPGLPVGNYFVGMIALGYQFDFIR